VELERLNARPPPKTMGLFITSVLEIFIEALYEFWLLLKKFIGLDIDEELVISSKGQTISAESRKISLL
jgi:hypothetical protein